MAFWNKKPSSSIVDRLAEERIYELVLEEIEAGTRRGGLWLKALENSQGDEKKAKLLYIGYRVQAMKDELEIAAAFQLEEAERNAASQRAQAERNHAHLNGYDEDGLTPLMRAVREVNLEKVKALLSMGADPTVKDDRFGTSTASDFAVRALRVAATEQERTQLRHIFDALDDAARSI